MDNLQEITPEDSVVPIYLAEPTEESIADEAFRRAEFEAMTAELEAKNAVKQSALQKLSQLGLTEDEARAIIGI
jgi:hypothetical protein